MSYADQVGRGKVPRISAHGGSGRPEARVARPLLSGDIVVSCWGDETMAMPMFFFSVRPDESAAVELVEVSAPDFLKAVQTLAAWRPGIHILKLEGVWASPPGHA